MEWRGSQLRPTNHRKTTIVAALLSSSSLPREAGGSGRSSVRWMAEKPPAQLQSQVAQQRVAALRARLASGVASPVPSLAAFSPVTCSPLSELQAAATQLLPSATLPSATLAAQQSERPLVALSLSSALCQVAQLLPPTPRLPCAAHPSSSTASMTWSRNPSVPASLISLPAAASEQVLAAPLGLRESLQPLPSTSIQPCGEAMGIQWNRLRDDLRQRDSDLHRRYVEQLDEHSYLIR